MQLEAVIERVWRCTRRQWSSECVDAPAGHDRANLDGVNERVWRYTWGPWSSEFGNAFAGRNPASLHECWEALDGRRAGCGDSFHYVVNLQPWEGDNVTLPLSSHGGTPEAEATFRGQLVIIRMKGIQTILDGCCTRCMLYSVYAVLGVWCTRCMVYSVYAVLGVCCTWCMLYSVYALLGVCYTRCQLKIMTWQDREGWLNFVFCDDCGVVDEDENDGEDTSGYE